MKHIIYAYTALPLMFIILLGSLIGCGTGNPSVESSLKSSEACVEQSDGIDTNDSTQSQMVEASSQSIENEYFSRTDLETIIKNKYPNFNPNEFNFSITDDGEKKYTAGFIMLVNEIETPYGYTVSIESNNIVNISEKIPEKINTQAFPKSITDAQKKAFEAEAEDNVKANYPDYTIVKIRGKVRFDPQKNITEYLVFVDYERDGLMGGADYSFTID